jgi:hypothetical protein
MDPSQSSSSFESKASFGVAVTSYEINEDKVATPILTHLFWGKTLDEAIGYAKSHLTTDWFFSSSFIGEMKWKKSVLRIEDEFDVLTPDLTPVSEKMVRKVAAELYAVAKEKHHQQMKAGMVGVIDIITRD